MLTYKCLWKTSQAWEKQRASNRCCAN